MDRKSLKRIDFAEFEKVGKHNFDQRYYARIKNEHNKVLVKKNSWGNYTILVDDVVHFEEPTKMETLLIETEDNGFVISNAIGRVYPLGKDLEMVTFTGHTTPFSDEVFIGRKKSNGNECLIRCNGLQNLDIREYRKIKYSKDRRCFVVWENSVITPCHVLNDCLCKVSENIQDISAPNSEGFSCKKNSRFKVRNWVD